MLKFWEKWRTVEGAMAPDGSPSEQVRVPVYHTTWERRQKTPVRRDRAPGDRAGPMPLALAPMMAWPD
ncbi:MAG: hypothetical protein HKP13_07100 [Gammaproteobacteria bacterium]|nr:hypothetical protein [Gammaproteobacteria bacterium]